MTLSGAAAAGPVLFGVAAPCSVWRGAGAGGMEVAGPLVVDPTVGARVSIREGDALPGFGAAARLTVPTQAYVWSLGSPGPSGEAGVVTDLDGRAEYRTEVVRPDQFGEQCSWPTTDGVAPAQQSGITATRR